MTTRAAVKPIHILIAEDNPGDMRLIRLALSETKNWPVNVSMARDGQQAVDMLESDPNGASTPDLVILDYNLPKRSGTYVLKMIRGNERLKRIPVFVLSSSPEYFLREKLQDSEGEGTRYFTKPFDFDEFVQLGGKFRECYESGGKGKLS